MGQAAIGNLNKSGKKNGNKIGGGRKAVLAAAQLPMLAWPAWAATVTADFGQGAGYPLNKSKINLYTTGIPSTKNFERDIPWLAKLKPEVLSLEFFWGMNQTLSRTVSGTPDNPVYDWAHFMDPCDCGGIERLGLLDLNGRRTHGSVCQGRAVPWAESGRGGSVRRRAFGSHGVRHAKGAGPGGGRVFGPDAVGILPGQVEAQAGPEEARIDALGRGKQAKGGVPGVPGWLARPPR